jgi:hypothetical protein
MRRQISRKRYPIGLRLRFLPDLTWNGDPTISLFKKGQTVNLRLNWIAFQILLLLTLASSATIGGPNHQHSGKDRRSAVIHYVYFDMETIMPLTVDDIRANKVCTHRLSAVDMKRLYALLERHVDPDPFPPNTVSLIIDPNPWGPRTLVGSLGNVKSGTREYRLANQDFSAVKAFINARAFYSFPKEIQQDLRRHRIKPVQSDRQ